MSVRELPPELKAIAKNELKEDEGKLEEHIEHIKEWLKKQPHIRARTDSQWLAAFIRGCKHSLEKTKKKLDAYYTVKTLMPEVFAGRDPKDPNLREIIDLGSCLPLPATPDPSSPRIILVRGGLYDTKKYNFVDMMRTNNMIMDILLLEDDRAAVVGVTSVLDLGKVGLDHLAQFNPLLVKKLIISSQDSYPIRDKNTHFLNLPPTFDTIYNVFKVFMSEKQKNRIVLHRDDVSLHKYIPKEILPSDYGGDGPSVAELTAQWKQKLLDYRDWFLEDENFGVDESKRIGKKVTADDFFGVDGSFKQLSID